jgi:uncharacterized protein
MDPIQPEAPEAPAVPSGVPEAQPALNSSPEAFPALPPAPQPQPPQPWETRILLNILLGPQGLRAGWSVLLFVILWGIFSGILGTIFIAMHLVDPRAKGMTATNSLFNELMIVLAMLGAAAIVALVERRPGNIMAFNLTGPRRVRRFIEGLVAGFVSLSALIGALAWGGWLHFGPIALSGSQIFKYAALWGAAFLLVGCFEEGMFRCYLQFTLTRGINFWIALGVIGAICAKLYFFNSGNGNWGVYGLAGLGLVPCLLLHLNKAASSNFWQAAWVTSTCFGFIHTGNNGENWIGIFAAGAIGFVFVVSVWVTGSAWWAIGCHAAWDWTETYFYGAIDSGFVANGHYFSVTPTPLKGSGWPVLWSGGSDGPEGSLLVIATIVLMIVALLAIYRRPEPVAEATPAAELAAG